MNLNENMTNNCWIQNEQFDKPPNKHPNEHNEFTQVTQLSIEMSLPIGLYLKFNDPGQIRSDQRWKKFDQHIPNLEFYLVFRNLCICFIQNDFHDAQNLLCYGGSSTVLTFLLCQ